MHQPTHQDGLVLCVRRGSDRYVCASSATLNLKELAATTLERYKKLVPLILVFCLFAIRYGLWQRRRGVHRAAEGSACHPRRLPCARVETRHCAFHLHSHPRRVRVGQPGQHVLRQRCDAVPLQLPTAADLFPSLHGAAGQGPEENLTARVPLHAADLRHVGRTIVRPPLFLALCAGVGVGVGVLTSHARSVAVLPCVRVTCCARSVASIRCLADTPSKYAAWARDSPPLFAPHATEAYGADSVWCSSPYRIRRSSCDACWTDSTKTPRRSSHESRARRRAAAAAPTRARRRKRPSRHKATTATRTASWSPLRWRLPPRPRRHHRPTTPASCRAYSRATS